MVIVDICGTLYDSNTTFDFLDYYVRTRGYRQFRALSRTTAWKIGNKLLFRIFRYDLTRVIAISFLKGKSREELHAAARSFSDSILSQKAYTAVHRLMQDMRERQRRVILVSATLDIIAEVVANQFRLSEWYASRLVYDENGICLGRLATDLLAGKHAFLECLGIGITIPYELTVTDNISDCDLLRHSDACIIVSKPRNISLWHRIIRKENLQHGTIINVD